MTQSQKTAEKSDTARASQEAKPARLHESAKQSTPVGTAVGRDGAARDVRQSGLPHSRLMQLQRSIGNQAVSRLLRSHVIQAKLEIGAVDDPLEREADHVAERVMRMTEPAPLSSSTSAAVVQRKCTECEEEEERTVRRKCQSCSEEAKEDEEEETPGRVSRKESAGAAGLDGADAPPIIREVLRSPGQPLDKATRDFFEPRFGRDFSRVRVHTDAQAADSASVTTASAYTVGHNIAFGDGQYSPGTNSGRRLIAHELAHVAQQVSPNSSGVRSGLKVQRQPRPGKAGRRQATVVVRWTERTDWFYIRVLGALSVSSGFRNIDSAAFDYASNSEHGLRDLVQSFQSQYPAFYHRHPKEGELVKLHLSAYYDPQADFQIINKER